MLHLQRLSASSRHWRGLIRTSVSLCLKPRSAFSSIASVPPNRPSTFARLLSTEANASGMCGCGRKSKNQCASDSNGDETPSKTLSKEDELKLLELGKKVHLEYRQANYVAAMQLAEEHLTATEAALGRHHPAMASAVNNKALIYKALGEFDRAAELYAQALTIYEHCYGQDHPSYVTSAHNLGIVEKLRGETDSALKHFQTAAEILSRIAEPDHPLVAAVNNNLGTVHRLKKSFAEAARLQREALRILRRKHGDEHAATAAIMNDLAMTLRYQGEAEGNNALLEEAVKLYEISVGIRGRCLGQEHPDHITGLHNLAEAYRALKQEDKALRIQYHILRLLGHEFTDKPTDSAANSTNSTAKAASTQ